MRGTCIFCSTLSQGETCTVWPGYPLFCQKMYVCTQRRIALPILLWWFMEGTPSLKCWTFTKILGRSISLVACISWLRYPWPGPMSVLRDRGKMTLLSGTTFRTISEWQLRSQAVNGRTSLFWIATWLPSPRPWSSIFWWNSPIDHYQ